RLKSKDATVIKRARNSLANTCTRIPFSPAQCPILALTVHLFSCPERTVTGKQQLFIGTDIKNRFGRTFHRVIAALNEEETCILGCNPDDTDTQSLRKDSGYYVLGQVYGPTIVSVYLRMDQSLGKLKDPYIHFAEGANQLCGRIIAGLPFNSERFAVLPPHFHPGLCEKMTINYWN
ncbi:hypothetical protein JG687_00015913, partial [Phytophthora cactorum]